MRKGFTLIEMLVVIGIIAVLIGASMGGYSAFVRKAQIGRAQELVSNVKTAMEAILQKKGSWPHKLLSAGAEGGAGGELTAEIGATLALNEVMSLTYEKYENETTGETSYRLTGNDRCGVVTPWAQDVIKRNRSAGDGTRVPTGGKVSDHRLHFAVDADGDGRTSANVGGVPVTIRGSVMVWCCGATGGDIDPYPYAKSGGGGKGETTKQGGRSDDIYSWTPGQLVK